MSRIDVIYWRIKGKGALSAQSKGSAWTIRAFLKYLSLSAFKIGYCYKICLLCLHCFLSSVSTDGLDLMSKYHEKLREYMRQWTWGRHMGDLRHQRKDVVPESKDYRSGQKPWMETNYVPQHRLRISEHFRPTALWPHGVVVGQAVTSMDMYWMMNFKSPVHRITEC